MNIVVMTEISAVFFVLIVLIACGKNAIPVHPPAKITKTNFPVRFIFKVTNNNTTEAEQKDNISAINEYLNILFLNKYQTITIINKEITKFELQA